MLSVGRRPASEDIGLESLGVYCERGAIKTDEHLQTNVPGVYAAGDVNGRSMLAHTAYREGGSERQSHARQVRSHELQRHTRRDLHQSRSRFCGGNRSIRTAERLQYKNGQVALCNTVGAYVAENEGGNGFCKVVYDQKQDRLLGIHVVGNSASEIIYGAGLLIDLQATPQRRQTHGLSAPYRQRDHP